MTSPLLFSGTALAVVALVAGALVPFQAGSNAALGRSLGHPLWATLASLLVSVLVLLPVLLLMRAPLPMLKQTLQMPLWFWSGGVAGVFYLTSALLLTPRLGATSFIVCVIAGQMLSSLLIDHYGWMRLAVKEANWGRIVGVLLILAGTLIVQWFTPPTTNSGKEVPLPEAPGDQPPHEPLRQGMSKPALAALNRDPAR